MSWTIDEESRCAIHVGGVCVTFDEDGHVDEVLAPKSIPVRVLLDLMVEAGRASGGVLGFDLPHTPGPIVSTSLRTVPLREAAGAVCKSLRGRILRGILGSERVAKLEELEHLVELSRVHGVEFR